MVTERSSTEEEMNTELTLDTADKGQDEETTKAALSEDTEMSAEPSSSMNCALERAGMTFGVRELTTRMLNGPAEIYGPPGSSRAHS